jgi:hypothetical protein
MIVSQIYTGAAKCLEDLKKLQVYSPGEFGRALMEVALELVPECQAVTPVGDRTYVDEHGLHRPGTLRDEIHAEGPIFEGKKISAKIITGPKSIEYALVQHEDLELLHNEGDAKFIERPLGKASQYINDRVAKKVNLFGALR